MATVAKHCKRVNKKMIIHFIVRHITVGNTVAGKRLQVLQNIYVPYPAIV